MFILTPESVKASATNKNYIGNAISSRNNLEGQKEELQLIQQSDNTKSGVRFSLGQKCNMEMHLKCHPS